MHGSIRVGLLAAVSAATLLGSALTTAPAVGRMSDTERVSVASNGAGGDSASLSADISPDGRYVVFWSMSENLVPGDHGWVVRGEVYLHDRVRHTTERVSPERSGGSAEGFRVGAPVVSAGGRFVAFDTAADDLPADDGDVESDVFVWDRREGATTLVSTPPVEGPEQSASRHAAISDDGRIVAYTSAVFEEDPAQGIDRAIYAYDRQDGTTELVFELDSTGGDGAAISPPALSPDGRYVAFRTSTGYGTDRASSSVLLHDRSTGQTEVVTGLGSAAVPDEPPAVSGDGRFVAFASASDELVPGDVNGGVDVFVRDRRTGSTQVVSVGDDGLPADGDSRSPSISADGRRVAFHSEATLSAHDTDRFADVYVYDRDTDRITLVNRDLEPDPRTDDRRVDPGSYDASIDDEGRHIAFSTPDRLSDGRDSNRVTDVYVRAYLGATESSPFPGVPCPDRTSASVTCTTDSKGRLVLRGTAFDERLFGTTGADVLRGGGGADTVTGHGGPDRLFGGAGRDLLHPGAGRDVVDCGTARDRVLGARGDKVRRDCERVRRS